MLKLKVGGQIRTTRLCAFCKGQLGTVIAVDETDKYLPYKVKCGDESYWICEGDIEPTKESRRSTSDFKAGDKVRVIDHRPANANEFPTWNDTMDRYAGKTGTVKRTADNGDIVVQFDDDWWNYRPEWLIPLKSTVGIIDAIRDNPIKDKLPLLSNNQLLTNIKLD